MKNARGPVKAKTKGSLPRSSNFNSESKPVSKKSKGPEFLKMSETFEPEISRSSNLELSAPPSALTPNAKDNTQFASSSLKKSEQVDLNKPISFAFASNSNGFKSEVLSKGQKGQDAGINAIIESTLNSQLSRSTNFQSNINNSQVISGARYEEVNEIAFKSEAKRYSLVESQIDSQSFVKKNNYKSNPKVDIKSSNDKAKDSLSNSRVMAGSTGLLKTGTQSVLEKRAPPKPKTDTSAILPSLSSDSIKDKKPVTPSKVPPAKPYYKKVTDSKTTEVTAPKLSSPLKKQNTPSPKALVSNIKENSSKKNLSSTASGSNGFDTTKTMSFNSMELQNLLSMRDLISDSSSVTLNQNNDLKLPESAPSDKNALPITSAAEKRRISLKTDLKSTALDKQADKQPTTKSSSETQTKQSSLGRFASPKMTDSLNVSTNIFSDIDRDLEISDNQPYKKSNSSVQKKIISDSSPKLRNTSPRTLNKSTDLSSNRDPSVDGEPKVAPIQVRQKTPVRKLPKRQRPDSNSTSELSKLNVLDQKRSQATRDKEPLRLLNKTSSTEDPFAGIELFKPRIIIPMEADNPSNGIVMNLNSNSSSQYKSEDSNKNNQSSDIDAFEFSKIRRKSNLVQPINKILPPNPQLSTPENAPSTGYFSEKKSQSLVQSNVLSVQETGNSDDPGRDLLRATNKIIPEELRLSSKVPIKPQESIVQWINGRILELPTIPYGKCEGPFNAEVVYTGYNSHRGRVRNYNEDRISINIKLNEKNKPKSPIKAPSKPEVNVNLFSIFDGHGGEDCSEYLMANLHDRILNEINFESPNFEEGIRKLYQSIDTQYLKRCSQNRTSYSGSCSITVGIMNSNLYCINVGDSRAIMSTKNGAEIVEISKDHKPESSTELKRILSCGGRIYRSIWNPVIRRTWDEFVSALEDFKKCEVQGKANKGYEYGPWRITPGGLSVSRSIGDFESKLTGLGAIAGCLINEPEVTQFKLTDADFIVIGCWLNR